MIEKIGTRLILGDSQKNIEGLPDEEKLSARNKSRKLILFISLIAFLLFILILTALFNRKLLIDTTSMQPNPSSISEKKDIYLVLESYDKSMKVVVKEGSFSGKGTITLQPYLSGSLGNLPASYRLVSSGFDLSIKDWIGEPKNIYPFSITFVFDDSHKLDAYLDQDITIAHLNERTNEYELLDTQIDHASKTITTDKAHNFGSYSLFAKKKCVDIENLMQRQELSNHDLIIKSQIWQDFDLLVWRFPDTVTVENYQESKVNEAIITIADGSNVRTYYLNDLWGKKVYEGPLCEEDDELCLSQKREGIPINWKSYSSKSPTLTKKSDNNGIYGLEIFSFADAENIQSRAVIQNVLNDVSVYKSNNEASCKDFGGGFRCNYKNKFDNKDIEIWRNIIEDSSLSFICGSI